MRLRSIIEKVYKSHTKRTTPTPSARMSTHNVTTAGADEVPLSSPEARRILEEKQTKFAAEQKHLIDTTTTMFNNLIENNRALTAKIIELEKENERLRRKNAKLVMYAEMREEELGERYDDGPHIKDTVAKLARL